MNEKNAYQYSVIVVGPPLEGNRRGFGAGKGGYTTYLEALFRYFNGHRINLIHSSYSVRSYTWYWKLLLPYRLLSDLITFSQILPKGFAVHLLATGGPAIYRNIGVCLLSYLKSQPIIVDVRGGGGIQRLKGKSLLRRILTHFMLRLSHTVLVQGKDIALNLSRIYGDKVKYQPNMILSEDVPVEVSQKLVNKTIKVVFVGYCYRLKGVFDLVNGCVLADNSGVLIELTLIGHVSDEFSQFIREIDMPPSMKLNVCGVLDRDEIINIMKDQDVFLFPSLHPGEGHPNVINEAMANELIIITTKHGYISDVLDDDTAYFIEKESPQSISNALSYVDVNRDLAVIKAKCAKQKLERCYLDNVILKNLEKYYSDAISDYKV